MTDKRVKDLLIAIDTGTGGVIRSTNERRIFRGHDQNRKTQNPPTINTSRDQVEPIPSV